MDALIVEDNRQMREAETRILEHAGFMTRAVDNGLAALAELGENEVRVIILDIEMPFLKGTEFYTELKDLHPEKTKSVIFVSGMLDQEPVRSFVAATGQPCLQKPFEVAELVAAVQAIEDRALLRRCP